MFIDARQIGPDGEISAGICIIGGGAAGLTIAREFIGTGTQVCVLESGGFEYSERAQALARGNVVGHPYFDLEIERVRQLGGCTNHWGGECRPMDPEDFAARDWIPYSGWPIARAELDPFYRRATAVVEIGAYEDFAWDWSRLLDQVPGYKALRFTTGHIAPRVFQNSPPTRFGARYRAELQAAANVRVVLNANLAGFVTDDTKQTVRGVEAATIGGSRFKVNAKMFILATGAIENARLLLAAAGPEGSSFGNAHGNVGRFFQEHISYRNIAMVLPASNPNMRDLVNRHDGAIAMAFTEAAQREQRLPNFTVFFDARRQGTDTPAVQSLKQLSWSARQGKVPDGFGTHLKRVFADLPAVARYAYDRVLNPEEQVAFFEMVLLLEQMPNPDSRVRVSSRRDALGLPIAELDWRLTDLDRRFMLKALDHTIREIGASGIGRVKALMPEDGAGWLDYVHGAHHPMGTTRMHDDPRQGVVDRNCRIHGMTNLFVAGSSIYATAGAACPTYSLVAFAIRLSDHLKQQAI